MIPGLFQRCTKFAVVVVEDVGLGQDIFQISDLDIAFEIGLILEI